MLWREVIIDWLDHPGDHNMLVPVGSPNYLRLLQQSSLIPSLWPGSSCCSRKNAYWRPTHYWLGWGVHEHWWPQKAIRVGVVHYKKINRTSPVGVKEYPGWGSAFLLSSLTMTTTTTTTTTKATTRPMTRVKSVDATSGCGGFEVGASVP